MIFKQDLHFTEILVIKIFLNWWSQIHLTIINEVISNFKEIFWIQLVYVFGTGELNSFTSKGSFWSKLLRLYPARQKRDLILLSLDQESEGAQEFFISILSTNTDNRWHRVYSTVRRNRLVKIKMIPVNMRYEHHTLLWNIFPSWNIVEFNQSWIYLSIFIAFVPKIAKYTLLWLVCFVCKKGETGSRVKKIWFLKIFITLYLKLYENFY